MTAQNQTHETASSKPSETATAADMAAETRDAAEARAESLKDKAKVEASRLADQAKSAAEDRVDGVKDYASSNIERTADQIRNAGREFGEDSYQAHAAEYLASNLGHAADVIRQQDLGTLAEDFNAFARRNPAVVIGGAALLGFAAARLLKASDRRADPYDPRFDAPAAGVAHTPYTRPRDRGDMS